MNHLIELHPDVKAALDSNKPVIALESTIISHGMPYPQNIEMAKKVEDIVREGGATPATIAIMDGKIKVGLDEASLEKLGNSEGVAKVSRRDLAEIVATKRIGATTVASTMICAEMAGIKFFVTGGIGGVHRGVEDTMDISADLDELGKTDVAVICAGAKSILDLDRTMEYLETKGVPVIGYKTDVLPAFFTRTSDIKLNTTADSTEEIASIIKAKHDLELGGGTVIANPILESDELPKEYIDQIVMEAVQESEEKGIGGKDSTPFLLGKIVEKTEGKSLEANIKLVYNNAKVGTEIAVNYFNKL